MTTTDIRFDKKQDFETIKSVIEKEFSNVSYHQSISDIKYVYFDFKEQSIYCAFAKDERIHTPTEIIHCSRLWSDRPNEIKTEAFRKIASYFDCTFWENDCNEDDFEVFKLSQEVPVRKNVLSVEWLLEKLIESGVNLLSEEVEFIEQAKEMQVQNMIDFAEWLSKNQWQKKNYTHPNKVGQYYSFIYCEYKTIQQLQNDFVNQNLKK